jgi:hypothetical protein
VDCSQHGAISVTFAFDTSLNTCGTRASRSTWKTVRGRKVSRKHRIEVKRQLNVIAGDCGFTKLADISCVATVMWMNRGGDRDGRSDA